MLSKCFGDQVDFLGGGRFYYMSAAGAEGWGGGCLQAVQDHLDHLGDSGIPVQEEEPRWSGGSSSTDWISVCACGAFTSIVCLSQTTGLLSDKPKEKRRKEEKILRKTPPADCISKR